MAKTNILTARICYMCNGVFMTNIDVRSCCDDCYYLSPLDPENWADLDLDYIEDDEPPLPKSRFGPKMIALICIVTLYFLVWA